MQGWCLPVGGCINFLFFSVLQVFHSFSGLEDLQRFKDPT
jgi:hypothetical protein